MLAIFSQASAATYYWDTNGNLVTASAATGTWGTNNFWSTDSTGATATSAQTIDNTSDLFFSAASNSTGGTVTVSGTQAAHSITFDDATGAITLSGGTAINLGSATAGSGLFFTNATGSANTISTGIILNSAATAIAITNSGTATQTIGAIIGSAASGTQAINVGSSSTGNISLGGAIGDGSGGGNVAVVINSTGTGGVSLLGTNTFSGGVTLNTGGTLFTGNNSSAFGTGTLIINGGRIDIANNAAVSGTTITTTNDNIWNASWTLGRGTTGTGIWNNNGNITLGANVVVSSANNNTNLNLGGVISGAFSLQSNANITTLSGANTYSGGTTTGILLNINNGGSGGTSSAIGTGALTITGGTINNTSGGAITLSTNNAQNWNADFTFTGTNSLNMGNGNVTINANRAVTVSANTLTVGGINGAFTFTKNGAGTLAITGTSGYNGATTVNAGTLDLGGGTANGSLASTALTLAGDGSFSYTRTGTNTQTLTTTAINSVLSTILVTSGNTLNLGTVSRGAGVTLDLSATGTLAALAASNTNGIMRGFTVGDSWAVANGINTAITGLSSYTQTSVAGTTAANYTGGNIDVDNSAGTLSAGIAANSLRFSTAAANILSLTGANTLAAGGILVGSGVGSNLSTITGGTLTGAASSELIVIQKNTAAGLTISSNIVNATSTSLTKSGAGLLTLAGNNTFTGGLLINAGTVVIGSAGALNSTAGSENAVTFGAGSTGKLSLAGTSVVIRSLDSNANVGTPIVENASASAATLTVGNSGNANSTFAGVIQDGTGGGALTLTKSGTGTLTLSGTNTYRGGTFLNAGTLSTSADSNLGTGGGITVGGSSIWYMGNTVLTYNRDLTINAGILTLNSGNNGKTLTGVLSGSGGIVGGNSTGYYFTNTGNTFTGAVTSGYEMQFASIGDSSNAFNISGATTGLIWTGGAKTFALRSLTLNATGTSIFANNGSGAVTFAQNLAFSGTVGTRALTLSGSNTGANAFNGNITDYSGSAVSVTKSGSGIWALSGTNTYSGTTVNGFTNPAGTLIFQGMQSLSPNTNITQTHVGGSGGFALVKFLDDSATPLSRSTVNYTFSNSNGFQNSTQLFVGNNSVANGGTSSSTTTGSTIQLGNMNFTQGAANVTAGQALIVTGANNYRLQLANLNINLFATTTTNYAVRVQADAPLLVTGTVQQTSDAGAGSTTGLTLDGTSTAEISGNIQNSAGGRVLSLAKTGAGTWTLSGANTYTGTTAVSGGILRFTGNSSVATGAVSVTGGALGGNNGSLGGAVTVSSAGGIDLRDSAVGTLTLGSTLAITGAAGANNLYFDLGNTTGTSDLLSVAGTTTVTTTGAAVINLYQLGGLAGRTAATYTLIGGAGTLDATNFAKFSLGTNKAFGQTYTLVHDSGTENGNLQVTAANVTSVTAAAFWKGGANNWSTTANWNTDATSSIGTGAAPDFQTNVTFNTTTPVAANLTTNVLDVDFDINSLNFSNTAAVTIGGTKMLTLEATNANGNTAGRGITSTQTTALTTISSKIGLAASQEWSVAGTTSALGGLTVSGIISDFNLNNSLTKAGSGTLTLSGANTFSGGVIHSAGTLNIDTSNSALGTGTFQIGASTGSTAVTLNALTARSITNAVNIYQDFTYTGTSTLSQGTGAVTLLTNGTTGTKAITVSSALNTVGLTLGAVGDGGLGYGLTKNGTGTLNLSSAFTYTGVTTINAGVLALTSASSQSGGKIVINDGGTLLVQSGGGQTVGITIGNNIELGGAGGSRTLQIYGSNNKSVFSGAITVTASANTTLNLIAGNSPGAVGGNNTTNGERGNLTISSAIPDGSGGVTLGLNISMDSQTTSGSYVNLSGQNTFTGPITVSYTKVAGGYLTIGGESFNNAGSNVRTNAVMGSGYLGGGNYTNTISLGANTILDYLSSANQILGGQISGAGQLLKEGTGTLTLSGTNTYTGITTVSSGTLLVNGSTHASSAVTVASGATLGGIGTVNGATTINGNLNPGTTNGVLSFGSSLILAGASTTNMEIDGLVRGTSYDGVNVVGALTYAGALVLDVGSILGADYTFNLFDSGSQSGSFTSVTLGGAYSGSLVNSAGVWSLTANNNTWVFTQSTGDLAFTVIPEPRAALLGCLGVLLLLRRKR